MSTSTDSAQHSEKKGEVTTIMTEREKFDQQMTISTDMVDFHGQYCQLASLLPDAEDVPLLLKCKQCHLYLGAVANSRGIALGHFYRKDNQWSRLAGGVTLVGRRQELKCPDCGFVTHWHQRRR